MSLPSHLHPRNNRKVAKALARWTPLGTAELITTPRRPSEQYARAEALAEILVRLALEMEAAAALEDKPQA